MSILEEVIRADGEYTQFREALGKQFRAGSDPKPLLVSGLCEGAADAFLVAGTKDTAGYRKGAALLFCQEEKECVRTVGLLRRFGLRAAFYEGRDLTFFDMSASHEYEHERLGVLFGLLTDSLDVVVTTPDTALGYTVPPEKLLSSVIRIGRDTRIDPSSLSLRLSAAGYARVDMVDGAGQFAVRGGIVDIFPPVGSFRDEDGGEKNGAFALRLELWDEDIDRMALFDPETQRVTDDIEAAELAPARELLAGRPALELLKKAIGDCFRATHDERAEETLVHERAAVDTALSDGSEVRFLDKYISLIYPEKACLLDYFPSGTRTAVFCRGYAALKERVKASAWHMDETVKELIAGGTIAPKYAEYGKAPAAFDAFLESHVTVCLDSMARGLGGTSLGGIFSFRTKHTVSYAEKNELLREDIGTLRAGGYRILLIAENETAAKNLAGLLADNGVPAVAGGRESGKETDSALAAVKPGEVLVIFREFVQGFEMSLPRIAVLSTIPDARSAGAVRADRTLTKKKKKTAAETILSFADLRVGDYVVHETYGIGQYLGIQNLTTGGVRRDYITIRYAGAEKLYLPVEKLDMVSKYIGAHADDGLIKLSHFGNDSWTRTKSRVRAAVRDMAKELIKLYAERKRRPGIAFPPDDDFQRDFEAAFEYTETESQEQAAEEIKADMIRPVPMDRLLCGDVGFGKTEVALRAAYKAVLGGKQVAVLVPTTLLALQHYQTATSRMRSFAVNVDMISRFRTAAQQKATLSRVARGEVDILIGTHRLLSGDVKFKNLGLLIVDEEQRFGVAQKEKLKQIAGNVDVLTLSATPIPRTLNMAMGGIRDISVLDEAPGDRQPVQTYVLEYSEPVILEAIRRELRRGGQVFYLYNQVENIHSVAARLGEALPEAHITVAHGQMDKEQLEEIWEQMLSGEIDVLVCTTIIETGVDIPNANTLIVERANCMGLSQLHQLRGRVGRSARRAYAYFTYPAGRAVSEIAEKRLGAIREYAEFGAGFRIALRDMEIRGAGNLLGAEQHGHMDAVGYDLYIKLLNEAVLEEQGIREAPRTECKVNLTMDAYLPDAYVADASQRMAMYKRIALIRSEADRRDVADELIDRYGDLPKPAVNLLGISLLRAYAEESGITSVGEGEGGIVLTPSAFDTDAWLDAADGMKGKLRVVPSAPPHLVFRPAKGDDALTLLHRMFEKYLSSVRGKSLDKTDAK